MTRSLILLLLCATIISGCAQKHEGHETDIFNKQQVSMLATGDSKRQLKAQSEYEQGVALLRHQQKPQDAVSMFRASILDNPTSRAFYELGNAYATLKDYQHALRCYQFAEQMGFTPSSRVLYNMACAYSQLDSINRAGEYLEYAIEAGYLNKRQLETDDDLANLRKNYNMSLAMETAFEGVDAPLNVLWETFVSLFKPMVLPATFANAPYDVDPMYEYIGANYERYVPEMQKQEKFSRGDGYEYHARGIVEQNARYVALMYQESNDPDMIDIGSGRYFLASYDRTGKLIDKMLIVGQVRQEDPFQSCVINANLTFQITSVQNTYKEDVDSNGDKRWSIASSEPRGTKYYRINDDGRFMETSAPLGGEPTLPVHGG